MAEYTKITNEDLVGHRVEELADTPAMTTSALKKRFDSLSTDVIIPKFNDLVDAISNLDGSVEDEFIATKQYVNDKDAEYFQDAKDYTDDEIASATTTIEGYADDQDAITLSSAMGYADDKDEDNLLAAKTYADDQDAITLQSAKDYTGEAIVNDANTYADGVGESTLQASKSYANGVGNTTLQLAKQYTDNNSVGSVGVTAYFVSGERVATINVDGTSTDIYATGGGGGGTTDYNNLSNKPSINGNSLSGNKTASQLGFATVSTSGSYNDLINKPTLKTVATSGLAVDITTDTGESLQKTLDELASFESITYKGTVANYASLPSNASNGDMYYVTADAKHYVCVKDDAISLYEWHDYHAFDDGYSITVENVKNTLDVTDSGYVLDARQGKILKDTTDNIMGGDAYSSTTTYAVGSCCIYENALYKAIQDNVVGIVPTNSSYWEKVTLASLSYNTQTLEAVDVNSNLTVYKYGKLRVARLNSLNITSGQSVQLPSDCYPIVFMSNVGIAGTTSVARINLNPSGQMYFSNGEGTRITGTVVGELVYFVE